MDIDIKLDNIQEDKKYVFEFCLKSENSKNIKASSTIKKQKDDDRPSIEDFEDKQEEKPKIEDNIKINREYKVESSFGGKKIEPTL